MAKKQLTSSVYTFENLIRGNFLYIDKSEYLWKLIEPRNAMFFLSRPRRFGKSLTVSTLKALFEGKKELFAGLAIADKPYDWKKYPVIHFDMNGRDFSSVAAAEESLRNLVAEQARALNVSLAMESATNMFQKLIETLSLVSPAVVLVDEYDKPILSNVASPSVNGILQLLKTFYSVIKAKEDVIRFAFVTGVTKFCHVSIFSDLNSLTDISMNQDYAAMLGYTQAEMEENFAEWIQETEKTQPLSHADYLTEIKNWYDGYRFAGNAPSVYNPVSLANFFNNHGEFRNYWFATGSPGFLFELMKQSSFNLPEALEDSVSASFFESFEINDLDPKVLLYQTGYLTIKAMVQTPVPYSKVTTAEYLLDFPNHEVRNSFNEHLLKFYANIRLDQAQRVIRNLLQAVGSGDADSFVRQLKVIFANIPYDMRGKAEHDYQTIIYVIFMMLNAYIEAEYRTNNGRIDLMLAAGEWIYIIELKLNRAPETALTQIENKDYALKFQNRGKHLMAIGINFDSANGQIAGYQKEEIPAI